MRSVSVSKTMAFSIISRGRKAYHDTAINCRVGTNKGLHDEGRDFVPVRQNDNVVASTLECPKIWVCRILDVKILQIDRVLIGERLENALEQFPVLIAVDPVFENSWLNFFELKTGVRMESKPVPVWSFDNKVADKKSFGCASQVQHPNHFVHF